MWFIKASEEQQQNKDTHFAADRHSFTRDALFPDPIIECIYFSTRKQTNKTIAVVGNGTSQIILFSKCILAFLSCLCHSRFNNRQAFHPISEFTKSIPGRNYHPYKVHTPPSFAQQLLTRVVLVGWWWWSATVSLRPTTTTKETGQSTKRHWPSDKIRNWILFTATEEKEPRLRILYRWFALYY